MIGESVSLNLDHDIAAALAAGHAKLACPGAWAARGVVGGTASTGASDLVACAGHLGASMARKSDSGRCGGAGVCKSGSEGLTVLKGVAWDLGSSLSG